MIKKRANNPILYIGTFIVVIVIMWQFNVVQYTLSSMAITIATPFWRAEHYLSAKFGEYYAFVSSKKTLFEESQKLKEKIAILNVRIIKESSMIKENKELKEILLRRPLYTESVLALVLTRPAYSSYDTLVIDRGRKQGIEKGNIITVSGNITIGFVARAYKNNSVIKLFSSPSEEIDVFLGTENITARAQGIGGGSFEIQIPKGILVREGDSIFFPIEDIGFVSFIEHIDSAPNNSFQNIFFRIPINIFELKWVEVILGSEYPVIITTSEGQDENVF